MEIGLIRYIPPRKADLDQKEKGNVFDAERRQRKRADKYTGVIGRKEKPFSKMPIYKKQYVLMGTKT